MEKFPAVVIIANFKLLVACGKAHPEIVYLIQTILISFYKLDFSIISSGYLVYKCQDPGLCKIEAGKVKPRLRKPIFIRASAALSVVICAVDM